MRHLLFLLLIVCSVSYAEEPPCVIADDVSEKCFVLLERNTLAEYVKVITKTGNVLEIRPKKGKPISFVANPDGEGDEYRRYHIIGVLKPGHFAVIRAGLWEGREVKLVSLDDGTIHEIDGMPLVSPDQKRILIHSMDIDANYNSNFIAVFRIWGTQLVKEFSLDGNSVKLGEWGPVAVRWSSPSKVQFLRFMRTSGGGHVSQPWELIRKNTVWTAKPQPNSSLQPTPLPGAAEL